MGRGTRAYGKANQRIGIDCTIVGYSLRLGIDVTARCGVEMYYVGYRRALEARRLQMNDLAIALD